MKKLLSIALSLILTTGLAASATAKAPATTAPTATAKATTAPAAPVLKKFKIGVAEIQATDEAVQRRAYYEKYIGPKYNVEFVFSELCTDDDKLLTFIENCADAGCKAVISFSNAASEHMTQVARELGMQYVINSVRIPNTEAVFNGGYDNFAAFGANQAATAQIFAEWLTKNASADGKEGFIICSGLAFRGNASQTDITTACLISLKDKYGLTFQNELNALATSGAPIEAKNNKNINIYIYPGHPTQDDGYLPGLTAALQTGKYNTMLQSVQIFDKTAVIVQETEQVTGKDIKVAAVATVSKTLRNAFAAKDRFGNPTVNMATGKPVSLTSASGFAQAYNLLTGFNKSTLTANGQAAELNSDMWPITSLEMLDIVSKWDNPADNSSWIVNDEILNKMLGIYNPSITNAQMQAVLNSVTYDSTLARMKK